MNLQNLSKTEITAVTASKKKKKMDNSPVSLCELDYIVWAQHFSRRYRSETGEIQMNRDYYLYNGGCGGMGHYVTVKM